MLKSIHPFDQSVVEEFQELSASELKFKIDLASRAFLHWKKTSLAQRSELMMKASVVLKKNKEKYAQTITREMGKIISEARAEVDKCAAGCEFFAQQAEFFLADEIVQTESKRSLIAFQPVGAVLAIMPWNFPFWQVFRFAAPALMAGNVGLLKHAPNVTRCSLMIEEVFSEAGFPEGVFQSLLVDVDKVESIIESPIVQGVALTGSERAGAEVAGISGRNIKKTVLELGGSDPFIVLPDADLDKAIKIAVQSRMQNAGQSCIAAKRFIVMDSIKDQFLQRFEQSVKALRQGNPFDEGITTGPIARIDLAEKLEQQLNQSIKAGAKLITGGSRTGCNFIPAIIDQVKSGMPAFDEELFGPVASVITVRSEIEAVDIANASRYGLGASIWTSDLDKGEYLARQIDSGSVFINSLMRSDVRLPFGGVKKSGYGRELSALGIKEFVNAKTIFIA